ncbi:MAG: CoA-binding protein [Chitinophagaceae bacterium]
MTTDKTTLVLGASDNPSRYSFLALQRLLKAGHSVRAIGRKPVRIENVKVETSQQPWKDIHTVTLYLSPPHQIEYYDYIVGLKPKRVIFNPGSENAELQDRLQQAGIPFLEACTLVMLSTHQY